MKKMKETTKTRLKTIGFNVGSFITMLAPLGFYIGFNSSEFVSTTTQIISLTTGGTIAVGLGVLACVGKLKEMINFNKGLTPFIVLFVICWCLEPVITNAKMLSLMILCGQVADTLTFRRRLKVQKEQTEEMEENKKLETVVAKAVETAIKNNDGRV